MQMAYWQKRQNRGDIQNYNSNLPTVMDFYLHDAIGTVFNEDDGTWDTGMVKVYDNFPMIFYIQINIPYLPKIMIQTASMKYKNDFKKISDDNALIATVRGINCITAAKLG
jgi:hypothetical protein